MQTLEKIDFSALDKVGHHLETNCSFVGLNVLKSQKVDVGRTILTIAKVLDGDTLVIAIVDDSNPREWCADVFLDSGRTPRAYIKGSFGGRFN